MRSEGRLESPTKNMNLPLAKPEEQLSPLPGPSLVFLHPAFPAHCFHTQEMGTLCATST